MNSNEQIEVLFPVMVIVILSESQYEGRQSSKV